MMSSDDGDTGSELVTKLPTSMCAASATLTVTVAAASKSVPSWARVSTALAVPGAVSRSEIVSPEIAVVSVKWVRATPLAKTVPVRSTVSVAPFRLPSVSAGVAVANASGVTTAMVKVSSPRSASDVSRSPSWAWNSTR